MVIWCLCRCRGMHVKDSLGTIRQTTGKKQWKHNFSTAQKQKKTTCVISVTTRGGGKWSPNHRQTRSWDLHRSDKKFFFFKNGGWALTLPWKSHHLLNGQPAVFWTVSAVTNLSLILPGYTCYKVITAAVQGAACTQYCSLYCEV